MATFKDEQGTEWAIKINMGTIKRLQEELDVDVGSLLEHQFKGLADLLANPFRFFSVISILVDKQAEAMGIDEVAFAERFNGPALHDSIDAFVDALASFYPSHHRKAILTLVAKIKRMWELAVEKDEENLEKLSDQDLMDIFGNMVANSQESSDVSTTTNT